MVLGSYLQPENCVTNNHGKIKEVENREMVNSKEKDTDQDKENVPRKKVNSHFIDVISLSMKHKL